MKRLNSSTALCTGKKTLCTGSVLAPVHTGKGPPGLPGHTVKSGFHKHTEQTNLTTIQPTTNAHDDRIRGRLTTKDYKLHSHNPGWEPTEPRGRLYSQAAPCEPDPAASRSQSASPRLLKSVDRRNEGKMKARAVALLPRK